MDRDGRLPETTAVPETIAEAAAASAEATTAAIEEAAAINQDPEVADVLQAAATSAEKTAGRVGWLRAFIRRFFHRGA